MKHICSACREGNCDYCSNYFGEDNNSEICFCTECEEDIYAKVDDEKPTYLYGIGDDYEYEDEWN